MQEEKEKTSSDGKVLLRYQQVHAFGEVHMGHQRCAEGEEADDHGSNAGLETE